MHRGGFVSIFVLLLSSCSTQMRPPDDPVYEIRHELSSEKTMSYLYKEHLMLNRERYANYSVIDDKYCYSSTAEFEFYGEKINTSFVYYYFETILSGYYLYKDKTYDFMIPFETFKWVAVFDSDKDYTKSWFSNVEVEISYPEKKAAFNTLEEIYFSNLHDALNNKLLEVFDKDNRTSFNLLTGIFSKDLIDGKVNYEDFL